MLSNFFGSCNRPPGSLNVPGSPLLQRGGPLTFFAVPFPPRLTRTPITPGLAPKPNWTNPAPRPKFSLNSFTWTVGGASCQDISNNAPCLDARRQPPVSHHRSTISAKTTSAPSDSAPGCQRAFWSQSAIRFPTESSPRTGPRAISIAVASKQRRAQFRPLWRKARVDRALPATPFPWIPIRWRMGTLPVQNSQCSGRDGRRES